MTHNCLFCNTSRLHNLVKFIPDKDESTFAMSVLSGLVGLELHPAENNCNVHVRHQSSCQVQNSVYSYEMFV